MGVKCNNKTVAFGKQYFHEMHQLVMFLYLLLC